MSTTHRNARSRGRVAAGASGVSVDERLDASDPTEIDAAGQPKTGLDAPGQPAYGRVFPFKPRTVRIIQLPTGSWHVADTWGVAFAPFRDRGAAVRHAVRHCREVGAVPDARDPNAREIAKRLHAQLKAHATRQKRRGVRA